MEGGSAPARPELAEQASQFMLLERAVEQEYRPLMLAELQRKVDVVAQAAQTTGLRARVAARPCTAKIPDRSRGWPGLESSVRGFRGSFVEPAMCKAGLCWTCWVWNQGASAVLWPPIGWQRGWHGCCWGWTSTP